MARKKPYTLFLLIIDIVLTTLTIGTYLAFVLVRELHLRDANRVKPYTVLLAIADLIAMVLMPGFWLVAMFFREMYRRQ